MLAYRKIQILVEDVQGKNVLTNFWGIQGMDFTTDKLRSLVHKWQTLIEAHVDVKTTDNFSLRISGCSALASLRDDLIRLNNLLCTVQSDQTDPSMMAEIMVNQASTCDLKDLVQKLSLKELGKRSRRLLQAFTPCKMFLFARSRF